MIKFKQYITEVIHGPTVFHNKNYTTDPSSREKNRPEFEQATELMLKKHHHLLSKLSPQQKSSIREYTSDSEMYFNEPLNSGTHEKEEFATKRIPHIDQAITSHEAPHDFHVYSGIKRSPLADEDGLHKSKPKEPFKAHIKQYTSASIRPEVAKMFVARDNEDKHFHMLKIHIPKGSKHGLYVEHLSANPGEHEFLMKRGLKLKVHHEPEIQKDYKIWHATVED